MKIKAEGDRMMAAFGARAAGRYDLRRLCCLMEVVATSSDRKAFVDSMMAEDVDTRSALSEACRRGAFNGRFYEQVCHPGLASPLTFVTSIMNVMKAKADRPRLAASDMRRAVNALIADVDG